MCEMLNLFVPVRRPSRCAAVDGLEFVEGGEVQRDFARWAAGRGTILAGTSAGPCLCGFADWPALYALARAQLRADRVPEVAFVKFWSGDRHELTERVIDPDDEDQCVEVPDGVIAVLRPVPAARREHRRRVRALTERVGRRVLLRFKSHEVRRGTLRAFDAEAEVGELDDGTCVIAAQLDAVDDP